MGLGWFKGKRKHVQSISFTSLKNDPFDEYRYAKKQIMYATNMDMKLIPFQMWKYKHDYRAYFNKNQMEKLDMLPDEISFHRRDYSNLKDYIKTGACDPNVPNLLSIIQLADRTKTFEGVPNENPSELDIVRHYCTQDTEEYKYMVYDEGVWWFSKIDENEPTESQTRLLYGNDPNDDGNYINDFGTFNSDKSRLSSYYYIYNVTVTDTEDPDTHEVTRTIEYEDSGTGDHTRYFDTRKWYYAKAYYLTEDDETDTTRYVYVPYQYYTEDAYTGGEVATLEFAPMMQIKGEDTLTDEERKKQKKALRIFGTDLDSIKSYIDNGKITDFRISLALSPDDATKSIAVTKYMFDFFSQVGGEAEFPENAGVERNREFEFELNGATVKMSFNLKSETINGTFPRPNDCYEYRVKLRQTVSNAEKFYEDMKDTYEEYVGSAGSKTIKEMFQDIRQRHRTDPAAWEDAYNDMPPDDCYKDKLLYRYVNAYCSPADFEKVLHEELYEKINNADEETQTYSIESYKRMKILKSSEEDQYYCKYTDPDVVNMVECKDEDGNPILDDEGNKTYEPDENANKTVIIKLYKKLDSNNYQVYTYGNGMLEYTVDGHKAVVHHDKLDGKLRFFMLYDSLKHTKFNQYVSLYDRALCGVIYVHQVIKIKWYQRAGWQLVFQIIIIVVSIAITVATAGAGAPIPTIIMNFAYAMAVSYAVSRIAENIGGPVGLIIAAVAQVAAMYFAPASTGVSGGSLFLTAADTFTKVVAFEEQAKMEKLAREYKKFKEDFDRKMHILQKMVDENSRDGYSQETLQSNHETRKLRDLLYGDNEITQEMLEATDDMAWQLQQVQTLDYNQGETLYNNMTSIPESNYNPELAMFSELEFGDMTTTRN